LLDAMGLNKHVDAQQPNTNINVDNIKVLFLILRLQNNPWSPDRDI
jgi:hypothetical protein